MKKTNTGVYLNKNANSPMIYKTAAIRSLIYRAWKISSSSTIFEETYKTIRNIFIANGFHYKFIDKIKNKITSKCTTTQPQDTSNPHTFYFRLPFIKEMESKNKKLTKEINNIINPSTALRIAYHTTKSSAYFPNKDKLSHDIRSQIVYQYKCDLCPGHIYTGETMRHFYTRKYEHYHGKPVPSEISLHEHSIKLENFKIVTQTKHHKIGEAIFNQNVLPNLRLNQNRPFFKLKLFNYEN